MPPLNTRVHKVLAQNGSIVFPGVYDTLSAKIVERVGFPMSFISGYSVAATAIGEPDMGLLTQTEIVERARRVCGSVKIPIIVDADTGYGNPLNVIRTVKELIITRRLEAALPKARSLALYVNVVEWGDGIWGAEAAARRYFGVSAASRTRAQAALLAGARFNPVRYSPGNAPARLLAK